MSDVYKEAMDAVKAPDALVEKTLKAMLEEHGRLEAKAGADAGLNEAESAAAGGRSTGPIPLNRATRGVEYELRPVVKAPPKKTHWMARAALPVAACLCLLLLVAAPRLLNREPDRYTTPPVNTQYGLGVETGTPGEPTEGIVAAVAPETAPPGTPEAPVAETPYADATAEATESVVEAVASENLATRSGPATGYRDTGTYPVKGETVRLVSLAYDEGGTGWVQCEVLYGDLLRRVYTGLKRFDTTTFDLATVPVEAPLGEQAAVTTTSKALYGPGDGYDAYAELTVDQGQTVTVIAIENGYAQVEWATAMQSYRAWMPVYSLRMN